MSFWAFYNVVVPILPDPKFNVVYNKRSIIMSIIMFINVAIMPLKAYISEPFPWERNEPVNFLPTCTVNLTLCSPAAFDYFKNQTQSMSNEQTYTSGDTWDIYRFSLPQLPLKSENPSNFLLKLPYSVFFTKFQRQQAYKLAREETNWDDFHSIRVERFFGLINAYSIVWTESNNTMYFAFVRQTTTKTWLVFKFIYRCCLSIYIMFIMWQQYYRYYSHLANNLRQYGINDAKPTDCITIIVGDPTSIVLLNPYVYLAFIVDIWISVEFVARALYRLDQLHNAKLCLLACLYLSRMLWMAYGALILVSYLLKKLHKEKCFHEADPTLTALAVLITTGPLTTLQTHTLIFLDLYYYLFCSFAKDDNSVDSTLPVVVYSLIIALLPITSGLLPQCKNRFCLRERASTIMLFGSFKMNDFKHRFTNYFSLLTFSEPAAIVDGGSIYQLFAHDRKFKRNLGMSQRGADCYLLYGFDQRSTSVRLSLLSCVDPNHLISSRVDENFAVGRFCLDNGKIRLIHGAHNSPWVA
ncbi:hypothetical protein THRCLA_11918 [Thraustotheca clavata]|uniref:Transmembrane protein n=1 Tax=Thraustotheca clavata TaxID=74557 RepID=A0A1V9Y582_9STRA|nr:hypothetical protein THRCLA_11918 [Thraustotheca clavata]